MAMQPSLESASGMGKKLIYNKNKRSNSVGNPSNPIFIENYGHSRRSNLKKKVKQVNDHRQSKITDDSPLFKKIFLTPVTQSNPHEEVEVKEES